MECWCEIPCGFRSGRRILDNLFMLERIIYIYIYLRKEGTFILEHVSEIMADTIY